MCDEGTADICAVYIKTVHRFQTVAFHRADRPDRVLCQYHSRFANTGEFMLRQGGRQDALINELRRRIDEWQEASGDTLSLPATPQSSAGCVQGLGCARVGRKQPAEV